MFEDELLENEELDTGAEDSEGGPAEGAAEGGNQPPASEVDGVEAAATTRRLEAETAERLKKQYDEEIAGLGIPNPYTGRPFGSFKEFQEYGKQFKRENLETEAKKKGVTVEALEEERENRSFLARKRREEQEQRAAVKAAQDRSAFLERDLKAFVGKHPDVDVAKLEQNPKFRKFAGDRLYRVPLSELYGDFSELVSDAERAAVEKAAGKQSRSTGGAQSGGMELLTPTQRSALDEWNTNNPDMKMTAKEFLGR